MLALATTTATLQQQAAEPARDAHGAPKQGGAVPAPRGPYAGHRDMERGRALDSNGQNRGSTWYLDPTAWPVRVGDTITDNADGTVWRVESADLQGAGLGLQQVVAPCSLLDVSAS